MLEGVQSTRQPRIIGSSVPVNYLFGGTHFAGVPLKSYIYDPLKCSVPTIRGVGLVNWTTPYTLQSGLNQSTVWDHVIGPNVCSGDDYNKASGCEEGVEYDAIGLNNEKPTSSPCPQRQRMHATLVLLFQWVEHTENDNGGEFMSERGTETSC